ncbi:MAG: sugar phosphate isomerase/epimerase [Candidatus Aenigmarchaeota archaeon]|nr:sugar phosphate isomerase/epimerase [Candidatus Aenigmarchaeota archaeon]
MRIAVSANNCRSADFAIWLRECESLGFQYVELTDSVMSEKNMNALKGLKIKPVSMHLNKTKSYNLDSYEEVAEFEKYIDRHVEIANALGIKSLSIAMPSFNSNKRRAESNLKISLLKPRAVRVVLETHSDTETQILGSVADIQNFIDSTKSAVGVQVETSYLYSQEISVEKFIERYQRNVKSFHVSDFVSKLSKGGFIIGTGDVKWGKLINAIKALEKSVKTEFPFIIDLDRNYSHHEAYMSKTALEKLISG